MNISIGLKDRVSVFPEVFHEIFHKKIFLTTIIARHNQAQGNSTHKKEGDYAQTDLGTKVGDNLKSQQNSENYTGEYQKFSEIFHVITPFLNKLLETSGPIVKSETVNQGFFVI